MKRTFVTFAFAMVIAFSARAEESYLLSARERIVEVPVAARAIERGAMIQEQDITWAEVPERKVSRGTVMEAEAIIGKIAKRRVREGEKISAHAIARPRIIEKGGMISIVYRTEAIQLKDMGIAMEDGSVGDVIRVKNEKSGKIVLAKVQKNGEVVVNYES